MALIKCPECGEEISDIAKKCLKCGYPIKKIKRQLNSKKWNSKNKGLIILVVGLIAIVIISFLIPKINSKNEHKDITEEVKPIAENVVLSVDDYLNRKISISELYDEINIQQDKIKKIADNSKKMDHLISVNITLLGLKTLSGELNESSINKAEIIKYRNEIADCIGIDKHKSN